MTASRNTRHALFGERVGPTDCTSDQFAPSRDGRPGRSRWPQVVTFTKGWTPDDPMAAGGVSESGAFRQLESPSDFFLLYLGRSGRVCVS
jgi:hypothetical protein